MSKFKEVREEAAAETRHARLTALQIAWIVVLTVISAVILWLVLSPSEPEKGPIISAPLPPQHQNAQNPAPVQKTPVGSQAVAKTEAVRQALTSAPQVDLVEKTKRGPLPKIAPDGRQPWQVYARPYSGSGRPRIAIVIDGIGLRKTSTDKAVSTLPPTTTLAFSPYSADLTARVEKARGAGHEVLLMLPMEPQDYPRHDPGPHALMTTVSTEENLNRLRWVLSRTTGYVGVVNEMGSKFTVSEGPLTPILGEIKSRGLLIMDARSSQYSIVAKLAQSSRIPRVINNRYIDDVPTEAHIKKRLDEIENIAKTYGAAAAIGRAHPVTMRTVTAWAAELDKRGIDLVPISAVANRQPVR